MEEKNCSGGEFKKILPRDDEAEEDKDGVSSFRKCKGLVAAFTDVLMMVVSVTCVQLLERKVPDFELNAIRQATGVLFFFIVSVFTGKGYIINKSEICGTLCLGFLSFGTSICIFIAVTFIPLSSERAIEMTSTMISGIILFAIFWKEVVSFKNILFAFLCICGVLLVIQPSFIFKTNDDIEESKYTTEESNHTSRETNSTSRSEQFEDTTHNGRVKFIIASILSVLAGIGFSASILLLKKCPYLSENLTKVLFWSFIFGTFLSAVPMAIFETPTLSLKWQEILLVFGHCSSFIIGWINALCAVQCISGNVINIVTSTSVVFMLISQYTVLSSVMPGHQNWMEIVGVVLILIGSIMGSVMEVCKF